MDNHKQLLFADNIVYKSFRHNSSLKNAEFCINLLYSVVELEPPRAKFSWQGPDFPNLEFLLPQNKKSEANNE